MTFRNHLYYFFVAKIDNCFVNSNTFYYFFLHKMKNRYKKDRAAIITEKNFVQYG